MFSTSGASDRGAPHRARSRSRSLRRASHEDHKENTMKVATNAAAGHMRCGYYRRVRFLRHVIACVFVARILTRDLFRTNLAALPDRPTRTISRRILNKTGGVLAKARFAMKRITVVVSMVAAVLFVV